MISSLFTFLVGLLFAGLAFDCVESLVAAANIKINLKGEGLFHVRKRF